MIVMAVLCPAFLAAHGVEVSDVSDDAAATVRTVRFMYSTGEPMSYAKIRVFPPSKPDTEILQAITAWDGCFSFVPDEEGAWRITAEDGMGHKGEIVVGNSGQGVGDSGGGGRGSGTAAEAPRALLAILGISLLANIFALWNYLSKRRKSG